MNIPKDRVYAARVQCKECRWRQQCFPAHLVGEALASFEKAIRQYDVPVGQILVHRGDPFTGYFAFRRGLLKALVPSVTGEERVAMFGYPGDIAGLAAQSDHWLGAVVVVAKAAVCYVPAWAINTLALKDRVIHLTAKRLREIYNYHISIAGGATGAKRLGKFLLNVGHRLATAPSKTRLRFQLIMNQYDIGSHLGMTKESVSRAFVDLKNRGLVDHKGKRVNILDPQALQAFIDEQA